MTMQFWFLIEFFVFLLRENSSESILTPAATLLEQTLKLTCSRSLVQSDRLKMSAPSTFFTSFSAAHRLSRRRTTCWTTPNLTHSWPTDRCRFPAGTMGPSSRPRANPWASWAWPPKTCLPSWRSCRLPCSSATWSSSRREIPIRRLCRTTQWRRNWLICLVSRLVHKHQFLFLFTDSLQLFAWRWRRWPKHSWSLV